MQSPLMWIMTCRADVYTCSSVAINLKLTFVTAKCAAKCAATTWSHVGCLLMGARAYGLPHISLHAVRNIKLAPHCSKF